MTLHNSYTGTLLIRMPLQVRVKLPENGNQGAKTHHANSPITAPAHNNNNRSTRPLSHYLEPTHTHRPTFQRCIITEDNSVSVCSCIFLDDG